MYSLARDLEREGRIEAAGILYREVAVGIPNADVSPHGISQNSIEGIRARSRERLEILTGRGGGFLDTLDFHGRALSRSSLGSSLLSMFAAGAVAPFGRLFGGILFRNLVSGRPLRALAYFSGFAAEVSTFCALERGIRTLSGEELEWSGEAVGHELISTALTFGALHGSGFVSRGLARNFFPASRVGQGVLTQAGMLFGVFTGHGLSILGNFRPEQDAGAFFAEGIALWAQYNAAGAVLRFISRGRLEALNLRAERYVSASASREAFDYRHPLLRPMWFFLGAGGIGGDGPGPGGGPRRSTPNILQEGTSSNQTRDSSIRFYRSEADPSGRSRWIRVEHASGSSEAREAADGFGEELILKMAGPEDARPLAEYMNLHVGESGQAGMPRFAFYSSINPEKMAGSLVERWGRDLQSPGWGRAWLLWDSSNSRIIGHLELRGSTVPQSLHRATLSMGLLKAFTGQGLGQVLLESAVEWSRDQRSLSWIDLGVFAENLPARKLYRRMGFQELGMRPDEFRLEDGTSIDGIFMTKRIR